MILFLSSLPILTISESALPPFSPPGPQNIPPYASGAPQTRTKGLLSPALRKSPEPRPPPRTAAPPDPRPIVPKPHRGACQNEDGFLSRESHVGVRLHQGLHSRQRQPRETSSGRTRRGWGLRSGCVPTGALLLPGSPTSRRHRRHPRPERPARGRQLCARRRGRPLSRARWKPRPLRARVSAPHAAEHCREFF